MSRIADLSTEGETAPREPRIRRKKVHKKSRKGCHGCKRSHVKCDELQPRCKRCLIRGLPCAYPGAAALGPEDAISMWSLSSWPAAAGSAAKETGFATAFRRLAGRVPDCLLWKYYLGHASKTMASTDCDPAYADMWQTAVPSVAHNDPATSHALMALSALWCASSHGAQLGESTFDYSATAKLHYCRSLEYLRTSMSKQGTTSPDALLACSLLLIPCGLMLARNGSSPTREWLFHVRGFRALGDSLLGSNWTATAQPHLQLMPFPQDGSPKRPMHDTCCSQAMLDDRSTLLLNSIERSHRDAIDTLRAAIAESGQTSIHSDTRTYTAAVDELQQVMDYVIGCCVPRRLRVIFSWTTEMPSSFEEMLMGHDELAYAIAAHWLVGTLLLDDLWFVRNFGAYRIERITERLEQTDSRYLSLLDWPREMLNDWRLASVGM
ncbi:Uu.00g001560.m01.CDS01 [Anthostomella pinea]|uniref:Uu.00g001560.m01.CDS01 n=1 Tax=Anthostomella pinea TaxID=933095 RepID=A0AAI8VK43_9PEZI|nr:Uu.00g001560.m01.CDS01 [Anthostomella pinea]